MPTGLESLMSLDTSKPPKPANGIDALNALDTTPGHMTASGKRVPELSTLDKIFDYINLGGHGLMMGAGDEAQAAMSGLGSVIGGGEFGPAYDKRLRESRDYLDEARDRTGWGGTAAEIGGSIIPAVTTMGASGASAIAPPLARVISGLGTGAASGAAYGFAEGEGGFEPRVRSAAIPAAVGGALGASGPILGAGIGKRMEAKARKRAAKAGDVPRDTVDILQNVFDVDTNFGSKPIEVPDHGMWADVGPGSRAMMGRVMEDTGGRVDDIATTTRRDAKVADFFRPKETLTESAIRERIAERTSQASDDLRQAMDDTLGVPMGQKSTETALRETNKPAMKAAYDRAYNSPIDYASEAGQDLETFLMTRIRPEAWKRAKQLMAEEGVESKQLIARELPDGSFKIERMPDVREIDYLKRALDDIVSRENAAGGKLGGTTAMGRAVGNTVRELLALTDEVAPAYGQARQVASVPIRQREALNTGYEFIAKQGRSADELADTIKNMRPEDREFLRQGARNALDELMAGARDSLVPVPSVTGFVSRQAIGDTEGQAIVKRLTARSMRDRLTVILGEREADKLFKEVDSAISAFELEGSTLFNVRKHAGKLLDKATGEDPSDILGQIMRGKPVAATGEAVGRTLGRGMADDLIRADRTKAGLAEVLTRPADQARMRALHASERPANAYRRGRRLTELLAARAGIPVAASNLMQFYGGQ